MNHSSLYCTAVLTCASLFVFTALITTGCKNRDARTDILSHNSSVAQTYAGYPIRLTLTINDQALAESNNVDVSIDAAVSETLVEEQDLTCAKIELKPKFHGSALELEIPTTDRFRTGIWHVPQIRFYLPAKKSWVDCQEGVDYEGLAFRLINTVGLEPAKGKLVLDNAEMVPQ